jgi:hypothetical protein
VFFIPSGWYPLGHNPSFSPHIITSSIAEGLAEKRKKTRPISVDHMPFILKGHEQTNYNNQVVSSYLDCFF